MRYLQGFFSLMIFGALFYALPAQAADEKIDPQTYICAELVASNVDGIPPIFEGLQLDGYASAKSGNMVADPTTLPAMLIRVSDSCGGVPGDKALQHWQEARKTIFVDDRSTWRADKTTCGDYVANPDDGSGFVIWLDAWQRGMSGKDASVLGEQKTLDAFLEKCRNSPKRLMKDVLAESAR